jgi:4-amino-4-deoxy-L-arabinose transferase-like glycosyltransferase
MTDNARARARDCLLICFAQAVLVAALRPFRDVPFIDDGVYAWPVEHFLATGRLAALEYANNVNVVQVLWGALFCWPGGFSFAALRVSTWVASCGGLCAFYLLLRDLGARRRDGLIGTAVVGLNPIYFVLQFSFMTDVPFLALTTGATWAMTRAIRGQRTAWLAGAVALASLACGARVAGGVWPVAAAVVLLAHAGTWGRHLGRVAMALVPLAVLAGLWKWNAATVVVTADLSEVSNGPAHRIAGLKEYGVPLLPVMSLTAVASAVAVLGPGLLPLAVAGPLTRRGAGVGAAALVVLLLVVWRQPGRFEPLHSGATWSWSEVGYVEVPNRPSYPPPPWLRGGLAALALASCGLLAARLPRPRQMEPLLAWQVAGHLGVVALLWLFYDRFLLVAVPLTVAVVVAGRGVAWPRVAVALIMPLAAISVVGTRDHLAYAQAHSAALTRLQATGAAASEIDAGYATNAWVQYAHPGNAPRDSDGKMLVPAFNTDVVPRYQLSHVAVPGTRVLGSVAFRRWLGPSGVIYLLEYPYALNRPGAEGRGPRRM